MNQSSRQLHEKFTLNEVFHITEGDRNTWGVFGYKGPKTYDYTYSSTEISFPKSKNSDLTLEASRRAKDPDPTTYAGDFDQNMKKSWKSIGARFDKSKKESLIDEVMKLSARVPGPGKYEDQKIKTLLKTSSYGKFDKSERLNFLSTTQALAEEIPSSGKYEPYTERDRKHSNWCKTAKPGQRKKQEVGPGYYKKVEDAIEKLTMETHPRFSIPRAKSARSISTAATNVRTPGVGTYVDSDKMGTMAYKVKKSTRRVIHPYKAKRYMDEIERLGKSVPGPGAYNIGSKIKKSKKF